MPLSLRVFLLTSAALVGFAANSLLCRAALLSGALIDPATFTAVRIVSGAVTLAIIVSVRYGAIPREGNAPSAIALFLYAIAFSYAYMRLTTATGALILFGVVQLTMLVVALRRGERTSATQIAGLVIAFSGLVILCAPGVRAPDPTGAVLMTVAGCSWGVYSLRGKRGGDPLLTTAGNFVRAVPLAAIVLLLSLRQIAATGNGILLAVLSGALASGVGYTLWYMALPHLTATRASIVQLSVPILAALGGVVVLREEVSLRLVIATTATIGGVVLAMRIRPGRAA